MWTNEEIDEIIQKLTESAIKRESLKKALESIEIPAKNLKIGGKARKVARVSRATHLTHNYREYAGILPNLPARNIEESTESALPYRRTADAELQSSPIPRIRSNKELENPPESPIIIEKMRQPRSKIILP